MLAWLCLGQGADLHMAQLIPLPLIIACSSKSRLVLPSWCWLTWVFPDKIQEDRKMVVCVCVWFWVLNLKLHSLYTVKFTKYSSGCSWICLYKSDQIRLRPDLKNLHLVLAHSPPIFTHSSSPSLSSPCLPTAISSLPFSSSFSGRWLGGYGHAAGFEAARRCLRFWLFFYWQSCQRLRPTCYHS